jgi:lipopolysaccharide transport system ATP-binding protein
MRELAIKAENISKQYRLGEVGTGTLSHDLNRLWYKMRGKEDPYLKVGEANDRTAKGDSEYVWSLRDVNFEVTQGDAVGIIGRNGAGKSTLLKLLSKVTKPTTGSFKVSGRIASLLEVGTGFNPEMTGRENIFLNGAILGMRRDEIKRKFDEIVAFSGVERYIDTPVKRYSSGMYVRLAFAVAAHLESEILIVDEVLAVGDAEFQKKCLGKMGEVSKGEGRTVLFVSHNMAAVKSLCNKGIVLDRGSVIFTGESQPAIDYYLANNMKLMDHSLEHRTDRLGNGKLKVVGIDYLNEKGDVVSEVISGHYVKIRLNLQNNGFVNYEKLFVGIAIDDNYENRVVSFLSDEMNANFTNAGESIELVIPNLNLRAATYHLTVQLSNDSTKKEDFLDVVEKATDLTVLQGDFWQTGKINRPGNFALLPSYYNR